jgi:hypothetical protein
MALPSITYRQMTGAVISCAGEHSALWRPRLPP